MVKGTVAKFNPFGAFVKLDPEIQGLAHVSEFGSEAKMKELLSLGQEHEFRILSIEPKEHRMALGLVRPEGLEVLVVDAEAALDSALGENTAPDNSAPNTQ